MTGLAREVAIVGVGTSPVSRGGDPRVELLAVTACGNAMEDAGLNGRDIDGILYPRELAEGKHRDISEFGDWRAYMNATGKGLPLRL